MDLRRNAREGTCTSHHHQVQPGHTSPPLVALITAGTAGLGAETARLFAKNGLRVVVNFNANQERALRLVEELRLLSPLGGSGLERKTLTSAAFRAISAIEMTSFASSTGQ